ncbi:MAG: hypothetical protein ACTTIV_06285 [Campylobacter sp.]
MRLKSIKIDKKTLQNSGQIALALISRKAKTLQTPNLAKSANRTINHQLSYGVRQAKTAKTSQTKFTQTKQILL